MNLGQDFHADVVNEKPWSLFAQILHSLQFSIMRQVDHARKQFSWPDGLWRYHLPWPHLLRPQMAPEHVQFLPQFLFLLVSLVWGRVVHPRGCFLSEYVLCGRRDPIHRVTYITAKFDGLGGTPRAAGLVDDGC